MYLSPPEYIEVTLSFQNPTTHCESFFLYSNFSMFGSLIYEECTLKQRSLADNRQSTSRQEQSTDKYERSTRTIQIVKGLVNWKHVTYAVLTVGALRALSTVRIGCAGLRPGVLGVIQSMTALQYGMSLQGHENMVITTILLVCNPIY